MEREPHLPPGSDQRTLFLVNTFVIHTVRLLNDFAVICEDKLADVHKRILRADATLLLLEAKLRSVDGLEGIDEQSRADAQQPDIACPPELEQSSSSQSATSELSRGNSMNVMLSTEHSQKLKAKDDPKFARFFRMLQVGVPLPAVKLQMSLEGLDGSLLDDPAALPPS